MNRILRLILVLWIVGYLAVSCGPLFGDSAVMGGVGLVAGAVLLIPWLIGVLVLVVFIWLTNPRRG